MNITNHQPMTLCCLINGPAQGPASQRAEDLVGCLPALDFSVQLVASGSSRLKSYLAFVNALNLRRPDVTYVMDNGLVGVLAATWHKIRCRNRVVIDTGDEIVALVRSSGMRGPIGLALTWLLERLSFVVADLFIVRGTQHRLLFEKRGIDAEVIQDGVQPQQFLATAAQDRRKQLGVEQSLTVGLVGSCIWSERMQMCYGWELVRALASLKDLPVVGLLVGDGDGVPHLQAECRRLGVDDRMRFLGRLPYSELIETVSAMDICLSTQTNDVVGQVRTTGKLPMYLAAGRFILASDVGEAKRVLPPEMRVAYRGTRDDEYPSRLANRIRQLAADPTAIAEALVSSPAIAKREFDYEVLVLRLAAQLKRRFARTR